MTVATDSLSLTFAALADPTRRAILGRLTRGAATVNELAAPFAMSQPAISKHLKVLEKAGLIRRGRQAQARPAELNAEQLQLVTRWLEQTRTHWEESFEKLDSYLATLQDTPTLKTQTPPRRKR